MWKWFSKFRKKSQNQLSFSRYNCLPHLADLTNLMVNFHSLILYVSNIY